MSARNRPADRSKCNQTRLRQRTWHPLWHEENPKWFGLAALQAARSYSWYEWTSVESKLDLDSRQFHPGRWWQGSCNLWEIYVSFIQTTQAHIDPAHPFNLVEDYPLQLKEWKKEDGGRKRQTGRGMHFSNSGYCYYCMVKAANRQLKLNHVGTEVNRESILVLMILTDFFLSCAVFLKLVLIFFTTSYSSKSQMQIL